MQIAVHAAPNLDLVPYAQAIAEKNGLPFLADPTRDTCNRLGFQTLYDIPKCFQIDVRERLLDAHLLQLTEGKGAIYGFSALSFAADWMRWCWSETGVERWERVEEKLRACIASYDEIHHLTAAPVLAYNGYAWLDTGNAAQIDRLLRVLGTDYCTQAQLRFVDASAAGAAA